jgi:putative ABC transport system permease protein
MEVTITKFKKYTAFVVFITIVIFGFMISMQIGDLINSIMKSKFDLIGAKTLRIKSASMTETEKNSLTNSDLEFLKSQKDTKITDAYGFAETMGEVIVSKQNSSCLIKAVTPDFINFTFLSINQGGNFIKDGDIAALRQVCVVNENFAEKYFKKLDVVGESITIKISSGATERFQITGVMKNQNLFISAPFKEDYFSEIYLPLPVATRFFGSKTISYIDVKVRDEYDLDTVAESLAKILEFRHGPGSNFIVEKNIDIIETQSELYNLIWTFVVAVRILIFLIGFIGIHIYMTQLINKRQREIATRKILGAGKFELYLQFQIESVILVGAGGVIGVFVAVIYGIVQKQLFGYGSTYNIISALITLLVTIILGLVGGYYPAKKATHIDILPGIRE